jgi:DNA repair protein RecN (Recombination protein N)
LHGQPDITAVLSEAGIEVDEEELIVEREIAANGKSRAFVANRPVTTAILRQLAPALGDIHGQNEQQLLFAAPAQRQLLDEYAHSEQLRGQTAAAFFAWRELGEKLEELGRNEQEKLRLLDLWTFQRK